MNYNYIIGIDTGTHTGVAVYNMRTKKLVCAFTMKIHDAFAFIKEFSATEIFVRFEDARQRKWFGKTYREKLQGAGSVKRDSAIWEDFLKGNGIEYEAVPPKNNKTKLNGNVFKKITEYKYKTSEHARDAAMLCWGF